MRKETTEKDPFWAKTGMQPYRLIAGNQRTEYLLYELRERQAELEMQNEELLRTHVSSEEYKGCCTELSLVAPVGYLILTHDGLIDEINTIALELIGIEREKLLHRHFSVFVTADDVEHWYAFFSDAIKNNEQQNTWLTLKRSDATEFSVQLDCRPVKNGDKKPVLYITLTNIIESKLTEKNLREIDAHTLPMALPSAEMGSWDWDITSGRVIFNERWAKLRGYQLEEIEHHVDTWENGIHPNDFSTYHAALTAHLDNLTPFFQVEYRIRTLSGPLIWILNRGVVSKRDTMGNPLHMAGIEIDITKNKRNNEELRVVATAFEPQEESMTLTDSHDIGLDNFKPANDTYW